MKKNKLAAALIGSLLSSSLLYSCFEVDKSNYRTRISDNSGVEQTDGVYNQNPDLNNQTGNVPVQNPNTIPEVNENTTVKNGNSDFYDNYPYNQNTVKNPGEIDVTTNNKIEEQEEANYGNTIPSNNNNSGITNNAPVTINPDINNYPTADDGNTSVPATGNTQVNTNQNSTQTDPVYQQNHPQDSQKNNQNTTTVNQNDKNSPQYTSGASGETDQRVYESEEEAKNDYLAHKNQEIINELMNEIKALHKKLDYISARVDQNQNQARETIPGLELGLSSKKAYSRTDIKNELAKIRIQQESARKKLAGLQNDQRDNFSTTKQVLSQEKTKFTMDVTRELAKIQSQINSNNVKPEQKQKLTQTYQLANSNLNKLKYLTPGQNWDAIRNNTEKVIKKVNPYFKS